MENFNKTIDKTIFWGLVATLALVFIKNAWVCDDAFIAFRSLDNVFRGNGITWNPGERVQVFTSPLWFILNLILGVFEKNYYLNVLCASFVLFLIFSVTTLRHIGDSILRVIFVLLLLSSSGFFDYTSSGLENMLEYLLLTMFIFSYFYFFKELSVGRLEGRKVLLVYIISNLLFLTRLDISLLILIPLGGVIFHHFRKSPSEAIRLIILSGIISLLWLAFSFVYFGSFFPNTYYAKLKTGIPLGDKIDQGLLYFRYSLKHDFITVCSISIATIILLTGNFVYRLLAYGSLLYLVYVIFAGGDFMQGRFFSGVFLVTLIGTIILIQSKIPERNPGRFQLYGAIFIVMLLTYAATYPGTPLLTSVKYVNADSDYFINDERGFYFPYTSFYQYLVSGDEFMKGYHDMKWVALANKISRPSVFIRPSVGMVGYKIKPFDYIIDMYALCDPFRARLPMSRGMPWRPGHYGRLVPDGYIRSIESGKAQLKDKELNEFYEKIRIVHDSKNLFSIKRFKTIVLLNIGYYDHLYRNWFRTHTVEHVRS